MDMAQFTIEGETPNIVKVEILETIQGLKKVFTKRINYNDFVKIINNSQIVEKMLRIGKLPSGFYDGNIDVNGGGFECLIVVPEGIKPLMYYESLFTVPFPSLLFYFKVRDGRVVSSSVHAMVSENVNDKTLLYKYPFGNVDEDGTICWGKNIVNKINDLRSIEKAVSMFFGSPTNDDFWSVENIKIPSTDSRVLQRGLIESLVGKKRFPDKILVPTQYRVGDIMKGDK